MASKSLSVLIVVVAALLCPAPRVNALLATKLMKTMTNTASSLASTTANIATSTVNEGLGVMSSATQVGLGLADAMTSTATSAASKSVSSAMKVASDAAGTIGNTAASTTNLMLDITNGAASAAVGTVSGAMNTAGALTKAVTSGKDLTSVVSDVSNVMSTAASQAYENTAALTGGAVNLGMNVMSNAVETASNLTSGMVNTVTDTVGAVADRISAGTDYYTIKYAFNLYRNCLKSCMMHIRNETARDECAAKRETWCVKMRKYSLKKLGTVYATKAAAKTAVNAVL